MYQGKHTKKECTNAPRRKRRLRWNKQFVLLVSVLALMIGMVGGSLAYLVTNTDPVQNTFTAAVPDVTIDEDFKEQTEKKDVKVTNTSDFTAYIRAAYTVYWLDTAGNIDASVPVGAYTIDINTTDWTEFSGVYYYNKGAVAAGAQTSNFINSCKPTDLAPEGYQLVVDVSAEVVQAVPTQAVKDVWGADAAKLVGVTD